MAECMHCKKVLKHGQNLGHVSHSSMRSQLKTQNRILLLANEVSAVRASGFFIVESSERADVDPPAQGSREVDGQVARGGRQQIPDSHLKNKEELGGVQEKAFCKRKNVRITCHLE